MRKIYEIVLGVYFLAEVCLIQLREKIRMHNTMHNLDKLKRKFKNIK